MASVFHLICDATEIVHHIIEEDLCNEIERRGNHYAALLIQRVWRGYVVRKYLKYLHSAATMIQKHVRGYLVRINMPKYLLAYLEYIRMKHYHRMATRIQAFWRGYWFRKIVCDFRAEYAMRMRLMQVNNEIRARMREEYARARRERLEQIENESRAIVLFTLFKLHHLLRTRQREGIYSLQDTSEYSWIEDLMKSIKFTKYMTALRALYNETYEEMKSKPNKFLLKGRWKQCEEAYYLKDKTQELKELELKDTFTQLKPFCMDPRVKYKDNELILLHEKFVNAIRNVERSIDKNANISMHDFDLTMKMIEYKLKTPPYHIDFWNRICRIHNIDDC